MKPAGYFRTLNEIDPPTRSPSIRALPSPSRISLWRALQIDLAGVRARDGEQRIHQARQPMGLLKHAPHHVAVFFAATIFLESRFAHAADSGQVSAQPMGCIGVKRRSWSKDCSSRPRLVLKTRARCPSSSSSFWVGSPHGGART